MSCTNSNKPPVLQLQQVPQLPTYPDASAPGDKEAVVDQYRNDLNRALYKNIQQLNNALSPAPGVDGTNGAAGAGGGLINMVSPLTTKGDIWGYSTNNTRIPVGADGTVLTADSTNALGVSYQAAAGGTTLTISLPATQALSAGDLVNIFSSSGTPSVRKASATSGFEAHGFTNAAVANGATCTVQLAGLNTHSSGLTAGRVFLHTTDGLVSNTCPSTAGQMGQEVGEAYAAGSYNFAWHPGVLLATTHTAATAGALQGQEFTASGTFNAPSGVTSVWITMIGAGGGGSATISASTGGGGGGSGELVQNLPVILNGNVTVTVGAKGSGAATGQVTAQAGGDGGDTSFGTQYLARGGKGGSTAGSSGSGGGTSGKAGSSVNAPGVNGSIGAQEAPTYFGGNSGGSGGNSAGQPGGAGSGAPGYPTGSALGSSASSQAGGGGGANSIYGVGGAGGNGGAVGTSAAATSYGSGGGGAGGHATTTLAGGDGAPGYVLVQWIA